MIWGWKCLHEEERDDLYCLLGWWNWDE